MMNRDFSKLIRLLRRADLDALARRAAARLLGRPLLLSVRTKPRHRPPSPGEGSDGTRLVMAGPSFRREGAPISQFELAAGLAGTGVDILAIAPEAGPLQEAYDREGLASRFEPAMRIDTSEPEAYEAGILRLSAGLRELGAGVVYANTIDQFPVIDAARRAGLASIWNIREGEPWRERLADRHPAVAQRALACFAYPVRVIFVAEEGRAIWRQFAPDHDNTCVIANAPRTLPPVLNEADRQALRTRAGAGLDDLLAVCVGTICERKGQADLAATLGKLPPEIASRWRVAFVGRDRDSWSERVRAACPPSLRPRLSFIGEVADAGPWYSASDACVLLSYHEAMARTLMEAAAAGRAILTTSVGAAQDWFRHDESALFVEPGDVRAAAEALEALSSANLRASLGAGALGVAQKLDFGGLIESYLACVKLAFEMGRPESVRPAVACCRF